MKLILRFSIVILIISISYYSKAQVSEATTVILLRHSEKDTVGKDPQLSAAGKARANTLPEIFKNLKPDVMYSTPFVRTRQTLMPWATKAGIEIKDYDAANLDAFAKELLLRKGKTIVVAGHSNTTPALVNLLISNIKYLPLNDSVYSKYWIVTIKDGVATDKMFEY